MEHSIEHRVLHKEWDEVIFPADVFIENYQIFQDDEGFTWDFYPTFKFENGEVHVDESWDVRGGKVSTSSFNRGVMGFDAKAGTYVEHYHFQSKELGDLISVTLTLTDKLKDILRAQS